MKFPEKAVNSWNTNDHGVNNAEGAVRWPVNTLAHTVHARVLSTTRANATHAHAHLFNHLSAHPETAPAPGMRSVLTPPPPCLTHRPAVTYRMTGNKSVAADLALVLRMLDTYHGHVQPLVQPLITITPHCTTHTTPHATTGHPVGGALLHVLC